MRSEVDVLTLTATPIPRTLHMALGRHPRHVERSRRRRRSACRSGPTSPSSTTQLVREAILREIERGGQVYFVHNRVHNIELIAAQAARSWCPKRTSLIGHGQMHEDQLEKVMLDFADGEADVLVCTTIIESGLDIPNVNTIIINNADRLGLAQLYQLRGRVGRGAARAYAYLLYEKHRALTRGRPAAPADDLRGDGAGRRLPDRPARPGDPRRRQPAGRRAERPHRRGRLRPVRAAAGRRGRSG